MHKVSLDASIMVYGVDKGDLVRHRTAKRVLRLVAQHECVLVLQALAEFYYVVTRKAKLEPAQARLQVGALRSAFPVVLPGAAALETAIEIAERYRINFWDAMLVGVARAADVTVLLTEDLQDGQDYAGLHCINPFGRSSATLKALLSG